MSSSTFKTVVFGDNYEEIVDSAEEVIAEFLGVDLEDVSRKANYELIIEKDESVSADLTYKAQVIARIR